MVLTASNTCLFVAGPNRHNENVLFDPPLYSLTTLVVSLSSFSLRFSTERACALSLSLILMDSGEILRDFTNVYLKSLGLCYIPKPNKDFHRVAQSRLIPADSQNRPGRDGCDRRLSSFFSQSRSAPHSATVRIRLVKRIFQPTALIPTPNFLFHCTFLTYSAPSEF